MTRIFKFLAILLIAATPAWTAVSAAVPEVQITDTQVGTGDVAELGMRVKVHYTGWLLDGTQFDTSRDSGSPFQFSIGAHEVIRGWDIGVQGMRVGGKRELIIPSELAYGKKGYPGAIPPNSVLKFEIELLEAHVNRKTFLKNDEFAAMLKRGVPVIDIRRASRRGSGLIEGAVLLPVFLETSAFSPVFLKTLKTIVGKNDEFILVSQKGKWGAYFANVLSERKGYTKVYSLQKGIDKWIADGYPVVKSK